MKRHFLAVVVLAGLVACSAGASRAPAISAMALARCLEISPAEGLKRTGPGDVSVAFWLKLTGLV